MTEKITLDEHRLWVVFHQTYDILTKCEDNALEGTGITSQQFLVLWLMQFMAEVSPGPITITDLAPSLFRSINSVSSIIDRMEQSGLVKKVRDLDDRRAIRLRVTRKGKQLFADAIKPSRRLTKNVFSIFTPEELQTLLDLLKKLKTRVIAECGIGEYKVDPELSNPAKIEKFLNSEKI